MGISQVFLPLVVQFELLRDRLLHITMLWGVRTLEV